MVFRGKYESHLREIIRINRKKGQSLKQLADVNNLSLSTVKRILKEKVKEDINGESAPKGKKNRVGRPRAVTKRDERKLLREIQRLRAEDGNGYFSLNELRAAAGLIHIPLYTIRRVLNRNGYQMLAARKKGILLASDLKKRTRFAKMMKSSYRKDVWSKEITFYLDGKSFVHKTNPFSSARNPRGRIWRKRNEGTERGCTAKGSKSGTGGKNVHLIVCISHGHGVCAVEKYDKMDGQYFTSFVTRRFPVLFDKFKKTSRKLWIQDGDPSQNCKTARTAWENLGANLISIPARSPDLNPIENVFNLAVKHLNKDTVEKLITRETYDEFVNRVINILFNIPVRIIDKTIESVGKRIEMVIKNKGKRLNY